MVDTQELAVDSLECVHTVMNDFSASDHVDAFSFINNALMETFVYTLDCFIKTM